MKKNNKTIYLVIIGVLLFTNILFISLFLNAKTPTLTPTNKSSATIIDRVAGVYHTNNYQNKYEDTITFNKDMTCQRSNTKQPCVWELKNDTTIEYTLTRYYVWVDEENIPLMDFGTEELCKQFLDGLDSKYTNKRCETKTTDPNVVTIVTGGVLIGNTLYNKIA